MGEKNAPLSRSDRKQFLKSSIFIICHTYYAVMITKNTSFYHFYDIDKNRTLPNRWTERRTFTSIWVLINLTVLALGTYTIKKEFRNSVYN